MAFIVFIGLLLAFLAFALGACLLALAIYIRTFIVLGQALAEALGLRRGLA